MRRYAGARVTGTPAGCMQTTADEFRKCVRVPFMVMGWKPAFAAHSMRHDSTALLTKPKPTTVMAVSTSLPPNTSPSRVTSDSSRGLTGRWMFTFVLAVERSPYRTFTGIWSHAALSCSSRGAAHVSVFSSMNVATDVLAFLAADGAPNTHSALPDSDGVNPSPYTVTTVPPRLSATVGWMRSMPNRLRSTTRNWYDSATVAVALRDTASIDSEPTTSRSRPATEKAIVPDGSSVVRMNLYTVLGFAPTVKATRPMFSDGSSVIADTSIVLVVRTSSDDSVADVVGCMISKLTRPVASSRRMLHTTRVVPRTSSHASICTHRCPTSVRQSAKFTCVGDTVVTFSSMPVAAFTWNVFMRHVASEAAPAPYARYSGPYAPSRDGTDTVATPRSKLHSALDDDDVDDEAAAYVPRARSDEASVVSPAALKRIDVIDASSKKFSVRLYASSTTVALMLVPLLLLFVVGDGVAVACCSCWRRRRVVEGWGVLAGASPGRVMLTMGWPRLIHTTDDVDDDDALDVAVSTSLRMSMMSDLRTKPYRAVPPRSRPEVGATYAPVLRRITSTGRDPVYTRSLSASTTYMFCPSVLFMATLSCDGVAAVEI
eukprot:PhM_4_TR16746/c0_g1_i1/m.56066